MSNYSVMIDIETFSQAKTAAIASIGACKFNSTSIVDSISINIDPRSCKEFGLDFQQETIEWWKSQKPEAFAALKTNRMPLKEALIVFSNWYGLVAVDTWACAPSFDLVILENAYQACNLVLPWKFYDERCFRTFKAMFKSSIIRKGTYHDASDDAIYQAEYMLDVLNK